MKTNSLDFDAQALREKILDLAMRGKLVPQDPNDEPASVYYSDLKLDPNKYIDNGDLIYAWSASFGPKIWNGGRVIFHYHIWKLKYDNTAIDKNFLYYFLLDKRNVVGETDLHGSTMKHITKTNMEHLPFPLPPLSEQSRIAAKIAQLFAIEED